MMTLQLSSGQGPAECELAVGKLYKSLKQEYPGIEIIASNHGTRSDSYRTIQIKTHEDLSFLEGTVQWICESPYRPTHKRKNWFVDVSLCGETHITHFDERDVRFETFRSGGKGGQHVNKVETGVRAIFIPTGLSVIATDARSQHLNKQIALERLCGEIAKRNRGDQEALKALQRMEHLRIERGNAVRVYAGMEFKRMR